MPIKSCKVGDKPGFRWGDTNKCWTYEPNNEESRKKAKKQVIRQAIKIESPKKFKEIMKSESSDEDYSEALSELLYDPETTQEELFVLMDTLGFNILEQAIVISKRGK
jgi:hypothetical protein